MHLHTQVQIFSLQAWPGPGFRAQVGGDGISPMAMQPVEAASPGSSAEAAGHAHIAEAGSREPLHLKRFAW